MFSLILIDEPFLFTGNWKSSTYDFFDMLPRKVPQTAVGTPPPSPPKETGIVGRGKRRPGAEKMLDELAKNKYYCIVPREPVVEFPKYIAMANICVSPTGFANHVLRDSLTEKVRLMSGDVSNAFTSQTTHIIAVHANTSKVNTARERNLPVMTQEWVIALWNACETRMNPYIHASLPEFQAYECPVFYNLNFVFSSRFDDESKKIYVDQVKQNGGSIRMLMRNTNTYFYICQEPEHSRTYLYAQERNLPCLPLAWITESIHQKRLANLRQFEVRGKSYSGFGETFDYGFVEEEDKGMSGRASGSYTPFEGVDSFYFFRALSAYRNSTKWCDCTDSKATVRLKDDLETEDDAESILNQTVIENHDDTVKDTQLPVTGDGKEKALKDPPSYAA